MKQTVFIDGHAGTTGLRIRHWLAERTDVAILMLDEAQRKSETARRQAMRDADLTVLCLPDDAARASGAWAAEDGVRVIDASSAHRV
ncbi:MAG: N-acetyl-gamma-glutamyl-phosphate reductase, partial [Chromatiales bacterium]|nr:N-acetyl-gamma-glutamyl-phosphate reductase [Chromatiales bacterium]